MSSGAFSPDGDPHPGEITNDDQVNGRRWTEQASEVSQALAWVQVEEGWLPVVRVLVTGEPGRLRITLFGPEGQFLESTVQAVPEEPKEDEAPPDEPNWL